LSTRPGRVQVLTILVPFIRETRHMDVCPETGSGHDIVDLRIDRSEVSRARARGAIGASRGRAWRCLTCQQAAYVDARQGSPRAGYLAGSTGTGSGGVVWVPMSIL